MADNVQFQSATPATPASTELVAADDIGGVKYQRVKITLGADGAADMDLDSGQQTMANSVPVAIASNQTAVPVSASSLPLPTGAATLAEQQSQTTALQIMDDWDESDRAKVNVIVGQAGITAGAGAVAANTPRTTLASDDPAVAALQIIDNMISGNEAQVDVITLPSLPAGTNNIGDVDILSIAAGDNNIGNVDVVTLPATPAGTNLIGTVNVQLDAATMRDGVGTALTPKFAVIDAATSGDNTLVSAVASKKIRVLAVFLIAAGTVTARFESGASGTALTGQMNLIANTGFVLPFSPVGWFETAVNTLLNLELSGAVSVDGSLVYVEAA